MDTVLGQRYRLGDRIGTGGTARVFQAHDERLDRQVAVKVLDEAAANTADPSLRRRFDSEARTAARFVHPNAVTIFDAGTDGGSLYLVMELVTGGSLAQRLSDTGPMTSDRAAVLGRQVASALAAAHAAGIIHRDVKPANVLLDDDGDAKLADFGIARRFDEIAESMTSTGMVMGTRTYVSPEQAYGQPLGPPTDIFSLGVTLYEAVTGVRPLSAIERAPDHRLDVRDVDPTIDSNLADVISRATAMSVDDRFASAGEMADVLGAATSPPASTGAQGAAVLGDNTQVMPEHLRPDIRAAAFADSATTPMTSAALPTPGVIAGAASPLIGAQLAEERNQHKRASRMAASIGAVVLLLGIGAYVLGRGDDSTSDAATDSNEAVALEIETSVEAAAVTSVPGITIPPTAPSATPAPTTVASTTLPPTTPAPPTEIIPGFPIPIDVQQFLATIDANPDLVGERGEELAKELDRVLRERPNRIAQRADDLRDRVEQWVDDEELDPAIAGVTIVYLDEAIAANPAPEGPGPGGDDDD